ncbi:MAG: HAD family hydrolase [Promethearchaeia archaeon]
MAEIKALVWDLDGTLIHFKIDFIRARKAAIQILKDYGVPEKDLTIKKSILDNVQNSREILQTQGKSNKFIQDMIEKVDEAVIEIEYEAALDATKVDGIEHVLEFAHTHDLKQAIYTFNTRQNAQISLEKAGLIKYFALIVGRNNIKNAKPHPDHLLTICDKLGVTPSEIVVLGDTSRDIEGALNVGAPSIAINTKISKFTKKETFLQADYVIQENEIPQRLLSLLKNLL